MAEVGIQKVSRTPSGLLRAIGLAFTLAVGVGAVIGAGILRAPGGVADHAPDPRLVLALWLAAGVHAALGANIVAELMAATPRSGGMFHVVGRAFGAPGAVLVGWTDWLVAVASLAALAIAAAEFLAILAPGLNLSPGPTAAAVTLGFVALNWIGVRESGWAQIATSAMKVLLLAGLSALIFLAAPPAATERTLNVGALTVGGVVVAYQLIVGVYSGWNNAAYFAEEDPRAGVNVPRALFGSVAAVTLLYVTFNAALLGSLDFQTLRASALPAADVMAGLFGSSAGKVIAAFALISVLSCMNANTLVATRILHGLAVERFLPRVIARVNRGGAPDVALAATAALTVGLALTGRYELVFLAMGALGQLVMALADASFFRLRVIEADRPRPFRAFGYPWAPGVALMLDSGLLVAFLAADPRSAAFMIVGVVACFPLAALAKGRSPRPD